MYHLPFHHLYFAQLAGQLLFHGCWDMRGTILPEYFDITGATFGQGRDAVQAGTKERSIIRSGWRERYGSTLAGA